MRTGFKAFAVMAATVFAVSACGSDNGPGNGGTELSASEAQALSQALVTAGATDPGAAAFAPFILTQVRATGTMSVQQAAQAAAAVSKQVSLSLHSAGAGDFDAVGIEVKYSFTSQGTTETGVLYGVYGWSGFDANAHTVDKAVSATVLDNGATDFVGSGTANFAEDAYGSYYDRSTGSHYAASSGSISLTSASFSGGSTNCGGTSQGVTVNCTLVKGTMQGSFNFTADKIDGSGGATYTQPTTTYNLPAVQMTISVTE